MAAPSIEARQPASPPPTREDQIQGALYSQNLRTSRRFAEKTYTPELIATVHDWAVKRCDDDPVFNQQMRASEDPYEAAYQAYQRDQIVSKVTPADLAEFERWKASRAAGATPPAATHQPTPTPTPAPPPKSLANQPNAGGAGRPETPMGPGAAFASVLNR